MASSNSQRSQSRNMSVAELLRTDPLQPGTEGGMNAPESSEASSIPRAQESNPSSPRRKFFDPARDLDSYISEDPEDDAPASPSTESVSSTSSSTNRYRLQIIQQPVAARACGHGERDRRVVDPPPIVQLLMDDFDYGSEDDQMALKQLSNIVHCTLLSVPHNKDVSATKDPFHPEKLQRRLMGTQAASPFVGYDPAAPEDLPKDHRPGVFFIFSDVSCRHTGRYRLRFDLMTLAAHTNDLGAQAMILASVDSDVFEVYNAKDFPGMKPSTSLARELRNQGANIPIKKGVDCVYGTPKPGKQKRKGNDSDDGTSDG